MESCTHQEAKWQLTGPFRSTSSNGKDNCVYNLCDVKLIWERCGSLEPEAMAAGVWHCAQLRTMQKLHVYGSPHTVPHTAPQ